MFRFIFKLLLFFFFWGCFTSSTHQTNTEIKLAESLSVWWEGGKVFDVCIVTFECQGDIRCVILVVPGSLLCISDSNYSPGEWYNFWQALQLQWPYIPWFSPSPESLRHAGVRGQVTGAWHPCSLLWDGDQPFPGAHWAWFPSLLSTHPTAHLANATLVCSELIRRKLWGSQLERFRRARLSLCLQRNDAANQCNYGLTSRLNCRFYFKLLSIHRALNPPRYRWRYVSTLMVFVCFFVLGSILPKCKPYLWFRHYWESWHGVLLWQIKRCLLSNLLQVWLTSGHVFLSSPAVIFRRRCVFSVPAWLVTRTPTFYLLAFLKSWSEMEPKNSHSEWFQF